MWLSPKGDREGAVRRRGVLAGARIAVWGARGLGAALRTGMEQE